MQHESEPCTARPIYAPAMAHKLVWLREIRDHVLKSQIFPWKYLDAYSSSIMIYSLAISRAVSSVPNLTASLAWPDRLFFFCYGHARLLNSSVRVGSA